MSTRFNNLRILLEDMSENPTWDECYAVRPTERRFGEKTTDMLVFPRISQKEEPSKLEKTPDEKDPVDTKEEQLLCPAPSTPAIHSTARRRNSQDRRRHRRAKEASLQRENHCFRGHVSELRRCVCQYHYCNRRESTPRRYTKCRSKPKKFRSIYRPSGTSCKHLPVILEPTKWYQVVGSKPCSLCRARGKYQHTSWICKSCEVPLCLLPYRNCYSEWHDLRGAAE